MDSDSFEGDNVVGYQTKDIEKFSPTAASFVQVSGGEDLTFADYKVNCKEDEEGVTGWVYLDDVFNTYTAVGLFKASYCYVPAWLAEALGEELGYAVTPGWYDVKDEGFETNCNGNKVPFGEGIIAKSTGTGAAVTFAGSVKPAATVTDIGKFTILGNCSPKNIAIGDIVVNCNEEEETATGWVYLDDVINTYTSVGLFDKSYCYVPAWLAEGLAEELGYPVKPGWYDVKDDGFENCVSETRIFAAGEGFVAKSTGVGATMTIKSALAK